MYYQCALSAQNNMRNREEDAHEINAQREKSFVGRSGWSKASYNSKICPMLRYESGQKQRVMGRKRGFEGVGRLGVCQKEFVHPQESFLSHLTYQA
ncbi:hypothetical protein NQ318_009724 [Aromia moschata]|uniref:Uncharacterized protein n=1 Tax=Aromia moschata TaxID=1265417 RepID=A0AAV8Y2J5_9CUCU|nr:hypothetical protein NQ318_009724 [Aromia moschata]